MKPRRKQPAATRSALLDAAAATFPVHGYHATGTALLAAASNLTKGALFHHFPDKPTLAAAWIAERLAAAIHDDWISPLDDVRSPVELRELCQRRLATHAGLAHATVLTNLIAEVSTRVPVPAAALDQILASWRNAVAAALQRGKDAGLTHPSVLPDAEAAFLVSLICGLAVAATTQELRRGALRAMDAYFETLRAAAK